MTRIIAGSLPGKSRHGETQIDLENSTLELYRTRKILEAETIRRGRWTTQERRDL